MTLNEVHGLLACLAVLVTSVLVLGAGGRPPDDGGGSTDDAADEADSDVFLTPMQTPEGSTSSPTDHSQTDMFLSPLGPGQCGRTTSLVHQLFHASVFVFLVLAVPYI